MAKSKVIEALAAYSARYRSQFTLCDIPITDNLQPECDSSDLLIIRAQEIKEHVERKQQESN